MLERDFQPILINEIKTRLDGCVIIKQDPLQRQGIPDLLILFRDKWAMLETKRHFKARRQPNQEYYVDKYAEMSFSAFIDPTNMDEVLDDLQSAFGVA